MDDADKNLLLAITCAIIFLVSLSFVFSYLEGNGVNEYSFYKKGIISSIQIGETSFFGHPNIYKYKITFKDDDEIKFYSKKDLKDELRFGKLCTIDKDKERIDIDCED